MGAVADPQLDRARLDRSAASRRREDRPADRRRAGHHGGRGFYVGEPVQAAGRGAGPAAGSDGDPDRSGQLPDRSLHRPGADRAAATWPRTASGARCACGAGRERGRADADACELPQRRDARHGGIDACGARRGRAGAVGPVALRRCGSAGVGSARRRSRGGLWLQISERRPWRAGVPARRRTTAIRSATAIDRLARPCRAVCLRRFLSAG